MSTVYHTNHVMSYDIVIYLSLYDVLTDIHLGHFMGQFVGKYTPGPWFAGSTVMHPAPKFPPAR